jgi:hypothetical protein
VTILRATRRILGPCIVALVVAVLTLTGAPDRSASPDIEPISAGRPARTLTGAPDPHVLRANGKYWAYTTNGSSYNIQRYVSDDLASWGRTSNPDALPNLPAWAAQSGQYQWAPTVFRNGNGKYVMYYVAHDSSSGDQCIGRAIADEPFDAFVPTDSSGPIICQHDKGGSIDPYFFENPINGNTFLYWKNDGNSCTSSCGGVRLWGIRLNSTTGLPQSSTPEAVAVDLLHYGATWETPLIENPAMTYTPADGGHFRLFYSANWYYTDDYATGYAECTSGGTPDPLPSGGCTKVTVNGPWMDSTPYAAGPGGASFFTDFEGKTWMAYHGFDPGHVGFSGGLLYPRYMFVEKVDLNANPEVGCTTTARPCINTSFPYSYHTAPPHPYVDVFPGDFAIDAISWISEASPPPAEASTAVSTGSGLDPDELFEPNANITRAQVAMWLWKLSGSPGPACSGGGPYPDVPCTYWAADAIAWGKAQGYFTAAPGNWSPGSNVGRGDFARMIWRMDCAPTNWSSSFSDVGPSSTYYDAVSWADHYSIMTGYADNTFRPTTAIQRDQAANALYTGRNRLWPEC